MTVKYVHVDVKFNGRLMVSDVEKACIEQEVSIHTVAEFAGITSSAIKAWRKPEHLPTMRNFLAVCNLLGLNPLRYFTT